jgi:serine/threonine protein kinase
MSDHQPINKDVSHHILLPKTLKFPPSSDEFYPI